MEDAVVAPPLSTNLSPQKKKRFRTVIYIVLFLVLTGVVIGAGIQLTSLLGKNENKEDDDVTVVTLSPTEASFPTDTPSPTPTEPVKPTAKPTSTPTPTNSPVLGSKDSTSGLDRNDLSIAVLNGSGETGAAGKMSTFLKDLGYAVSSVGNADTYDYTSVTILIKSSKKDYLALLKKDIEGTYTVGSTSEDLTASSSADAHVIVGK